jgi:hypothetical protein
MSRFLALGFVLLAVALPVNSAEMILEVIPLKHRLVNDILPTLQALVAEGGTVTGMNDQLIIRSTPENMADLKNVLAALDAKLKQLRISVRQDIDADSQLREDELSARIGGGDVQARVGRPGHGPGASITYGDGDSHLQYRNFSTRGVHDADNTHFVTAVEGTPAFISAGTSVPLPEYSTVLTPYGGALHESIAYRDVGSGFYVLPRVAGDRINLEISPFAENLSHAGGGLIESRGLSTTVSGRLGQWIPLGGAAEAFNDSTSGTLYRTRRQGSDVYDVWVKVDVLP